MPAQTDNSTILAAQNQIVQAILDLLAGEINVTLPEGAIQVNVTIPENAIQVNCSGGGGCGGCNTCGGGGDVTSVNDGPQVVQPDPNEDPPPDGFPDWNTYNSYKCQAANYVFDQYVGSIRNWGGLFGLTGGLTIAVIVGLLLLTVPPVGLTAILSALGILFGIDVGLFANFTEVANDLEDNRDDIICQLYQSTDTGEAKTILTTETDEVIDNLDLPVLAAPALKSACSNILWNDNLKVLFERTVSILDYSATTDCSACEGEYECVYGEVLSDNGTTIVIAAAPAPGGYLAGFTIPDGPKDIVTSLVEGPMVTPGGTISCVTRVSTVGGCSCAQDCNSGCWDYKSATADFGPFINVYTIFYRSGDEFTIQIVRS